MTRKQFAAQVETMMVVLEAMKSLGNIGSAAAYALDQTDVPLAVCECAALLSGNDVTFAKMFNRRFRRDACTMMFERAVHSVAA